MEFDFSRYSKIVANDLSLNGSISSALGGLSQWSSSSSDIYFNDGNVGIGTTSPASKLDVFGRISTRGVNGEGSGGINFYGNGSGGDNGFGFLGRGDTNFTGIGFYFSGWKHAFLDNGLVGIGKTNPQSTLDVNGAIRANYGTTSYHQSVFGINSIGSPNQFANQAYFGHLDQINTGTYGNYAILQNSSGVTFVNAASGQLIHFRFNNVTAKTLNSSGTFGSSDDRLKTDEQKITNATETIMKLSPQIYKKYLTMDLSDDYGIQSGFIAQDIWYNAPELRHLVYPGHDASGNKVTPHELPDGVNTLQNIQDDPDYNALGWGETEVGVDYEQIIAYLVGSIQEQQTIIETEKAKTTSLETQVTSLESQLADVLQRLSNANL